MKVLTRVAWLFLGIGIVLEIAAGIVWNRTDTFLENSVVTEGLVIDLVLGMSSSDSSTAGYHPVVRFATESGESIEFRSSISSHPPAYEKGEAVTVRYDPDHHYNAKIDGFFSIWIGVVVLLPLGLLFMVPGIVIITITFKSKKRREHLKLMGRTTWVDISRIELDRSTSIQGKHPWRIYADWKDPLNAAQYTFKSSCLMFDPSPHLSRDRIQVCYDPYNPRNYQMNLDDLNNQNIGKIVDL